MENKRYGVIEFIIGNDANRFELETDDLAKAIQYAKDGFEENSIPHLVKDIAADEIIFEAK